MFSRSALPTDRSAGSVAIAGRVRGSLYGRPARRVCVVGYGGPVVHARHRRFFAVMAVLAAVIALLQGVSGLTDLVLYAGPVLLLAGLLFCGRFVGEERVISRLRRTAAPARRPRVRARWPRVPARTLASLLAHDPRDERGPPAFVLAA